MQVLTWVLHDFYITDALSNRELRHLQVEVLKYNSVYHTEMLQEGLCTSDIVATFIYNTSC